MHPRDSASNMHRDKEHQPLLRQWLPLFGPFGRPNLCTRRPRVRTLLDEVDLRVGALNHAVLHLGREHLLEALQLGDAVRVQPFGPNPLFHACLALKRLAHTKTEHHPDGCPRCEVCGARICRCVLDFVVQHVLVPHVAHALLH